MDALLMRSASASLPTTLSTQVSASNHPWQPIPTATPAHNTLLFADDAAMSSEILAARDTMPTDTAGSDGLQTENSGGVVNYYFVFFALLLCIAGLCVYFVWRKRRNALMVYNSNNVAGQYPRDVREWDTVRHRRRYWQTQQRNAPASREEGLNENGEAPPPYMPKEDDDATGPQANGQFGSGGNTPAQPAIPMQTLSRDQAGLKPPGYEQSVLPVEGGASGSRPSP